MPLAAVYQPAANAAFQRCHNSQTLEHSHIPGYKAKPFHIAYIKGGVYKRQRHRQYGQPLDTAFWPAAFFNHHNNSPCGADRRPGHYGKVPDRVRRIAASPYLGVGRKRKNQLVSVVGQHHRHKRECGYIQKPRPARQLVVFRPAKRHCCEHRYQGYQQYGYIIAVPQPPRRGGG